MEDLKRRKKIFTCILVNWICLLFMIVFFILRPILLKVMHLWIFILVLIIGITFTILACVASRQPEESKINKITTSLFEYFQIVLYALLIVESIFGFVFFPATVNQSSMVPTLLDGEKVLIKPTSSFKRFDIVVFEFNCQKQKEYSGIENDTLLIKRIIALPGETFYFKNHQLYINDELVEDEFANPHTRDFDLESVLTEELKEKAKQENGSYIIPKGWYLLLGDNRATSIDSEEFGLVHISQIYGKATHKIQSLFSWEKLNQKKESLK